MLYRSSKSYFWSSFQMYRTTCKTSIKEHTEIFLKIHVRRVQKCHLPTDIIIRQNASSIVKYFRYPLKTCILSINQTPSLTSH